MQDRGGGMTQAELAAGLSSAQQHPLLRVLLEGADQRTARPPAASTGSASERCPVRTAPPTAPPGCRSTGINLRACPARPAASLDAPRSWCRSCRHCSPGAQRMQRRQQAALVGIGQIALRCQRCTARMICARRASCSGRSAVPSSTGSTARLSGSRHQGLGRRSSHGPSARGARPPGPRPAPEPAGTAPRRGASIHSSIARSARGRTRPACGRRQRKRAVQGERRREGGSSQG